MKRTTSKFRRMLQLAQLGLQVALLQLTACSDSEDIASRTDAIRASTALVLTQHQGSSRFVTAWSALGTVTTEYGDEASNTAVHGGAVRYADGSVLALDYASKAYFRTTLSADAAQRNAMRQSLITPDANGGIAASVSESVERTHLHRKILGLQTRAYIRTLNGATSRVWYVEDGPKPPRGVRETLATMAGMTQAAEHCEDDDDADDYDDRCGKTVPPIELAGRIIMRVETLSGGVWTTSLDTTAVTTSSISDTMFEPPAGFTQNAPPAAAPAPVGAGFAISAPLAASGGLTATISRGPGPVMPVSELHVYYYGSEFQNTALVSQLGNALDDMTSPTAMASLQQYGVMSARVVSSHVLPIDPPRELGKPVVTAGTANVFLVSRMYSDGPLFWWKLGAAPLFVIFMKDDGLTDWTGYHMAVPSPTFLLPFPINLFAQDFIPYALVKVPTDAMSIPEGVLAQRDDCFGAGQPASCSGVSALDRATQYASHEFFEAVTDPYPPFGWLDAGKDWFTEGELGDICDLNTPPSRVTRVGNSSLSTFWSVAAQDCVGPYRASLHIDAPANGQLFGWANGGITIDVSATALGAVDRGATAGRHVLWKVDGLYALDGGTTVHGITAKLKISSSGSHTITAVFEDPTGFVASDQISIDVGCSPGEMLCNGACTDTRTDAGNCGACGNSCTAAGQFCDSSTCQCPPFQTVCNGQCRDLRSDSGNCGTCGNACGNGQVCGGSVCHAVACGGRIGAGTETDVNGQQFQTAYDTLTKFTWQYGWTDASGDGLDYASALSACATLGPDWVIPSDTDIGTIAANKWCGFQMPQHLSPQSFYSAVAFWTTTLGFDGTSYSPKTLDPFTGDEIVTKKQYAFNLNGSTLGVRCVRYY